MSTAAEQIMKSGGFFHPEDEEEKKPEEEEASLGKTVTSKIGNILKDLGRSRDSKRTN